MKQDRTLMDFLFIAIIGGWCLVVWAEDSLPGKDVESLLAIAEERNPEYAGQRFEADAALARVVSAGALPDPKIQIELRDITRLGAQDPTLFPNQVGNTRYLITQEIPWFGKRELKRTVAEFEAEGSQGQAASVWNDIAAKIKIAHAERYYLSRNERLTNEILDLMVRLERIAETRYGNGLATLQDVVRAQVEQTSLRNELIAIETEYHHRNTLINALLARDPMTPLAEPERLRPLPPPAKLDYAVLLLRVQSHNPLLSSAEARLAAAEKNRDLVYKNRYPDFTFGVSPIQYQNSIKEWELMVQVNIPLQQSSRRAAEHESEAMLSAARMRSEMTINQVRSDLAENISGIESVRKTETELSDRLLPQSEINFRAALAGYENGKVDFSTLLDAERQTRQAKQALLKVQLEGQSRLAEIERVLGAAL